MKDSRSSLSARNSLYSPFETGFLLGHMTAILPTLRISSVIVFRSGEFCCMTNKILPLVAEMIATAKM